jgi:hypothetical protein
MTQKYHIADIAAPAAEPANTWSRVWSWRYTLENGTGRNRRA